MKWRMVGIGRPALAYARTGIDEYLSRVKRYAEVEMVWVKEGASSAETARRVLEQCEGWRTVLLDETGRALSTREWRSVLDDWENQGTRRVAVLVGGANGHSPEIKDAVSERWSLGRLTLQHELAMLVWMEQLYRLQTLGKGEPYHRD